MEAIVNGTNTEIHRDDCDKEKLVKVIHPFQASDVMNRNIVANPESNVVPGRKKVTTQQKEEKQSVSEEIQSTKSDASDEAEDKTDSLGKETKKQSGTITGGDRISPLQLGRLELDYLEDDGESSVCSENIYHSGDFSSFLSDPPAKCSILDRRFDLRRNERGSLVEILERQQRESVGNRLKELHMTNKRHSMSAATTEMPIIAKSKPFRDAILPKQTRRTNYQSVILAPFFAKSSTSARSLHLGFGPESKERRNSLTLSRVQTPTNSFWESRSYFPLRETESLSGMEHFVESGDYTSHAFRRPFSESINTVNGLAGSSGPTEGQSHLNGIQRSNQCLNTDVKPSDTSRSLNASDPKFTMTDLKCKYSFDESEEDSPESASETGRLEENSRQDTMTSQVIDSFLSPYSKENLISETTAGSTPLEGQDEIFPASALESADQDYLNNSYSITASDKSSKTFVTDHRAEENPDTIISDEVIRTPVHFETFSNSISNSNLPEKRFINDNETNVIISASPNTAAIGDIYAQKDDSAFPVETKKFYSDIRIQLKKMEAVYPSNFNKEKTVASEGSNFVKSVGAALSTLQKQHNKSSPTKDEGSEEDEDVPQVAPNWSSYPGLLKHVSSPANLDENEPSLFNDYPKTSVSKFETSLSSGISILDVIGQESKKNLTDNKSDTRSFVPSSESLSDQSSRHEIKMPAKVITNIDNYNAQNAFKNAKNNGYFLEDGDAPKVTEHQEIYLIDSSPGDRKTCTLPSGLPRFRIFNGRSSEKIFSESYNYFRNPPSQRNELKLTIRGRSVEETAATVTLESRSSRIITPSLSDVTKITFDSRQDESDTRKINGEMSRSNLDSSSGKFSKPEKNWRALAIYSDERSAEKKSPKDANKSIENTPSIERIWESLEEPHPKLLKLKNRLESDSGVGRIAERQPLLRSRISSYDGSNECQKTFRSTSTEEVIRHQSIVLEENKEYSMLMLEVPKGGLGLGFCIEGGKDGPYGDRPITVKRLFRGLSDPKVTSGTKDGLRAGDEIISANGRDMTLLSRFVAWNYLKTLPEGMIKLVVRRPKNSDSK